MSWEPYLSSGDSALLRKALGGRSGESCLEIGAGNGGNLVFLAGKFGLAVGTDLVRPRMADWKGAGADFVLADRASCMRDGSFDLVAFNPPYLAGDSDDGAVDGGKSLDAPKGFLSEAIRVVKKEGEVVFLLNDEAEVEEFREIAAKGGFALKLLASERMFFEELSVFSATSGEAERPSRPLKGASRGDVHR